jgi:hypothetical protein
MDFSFSDGKIHVVQRHDSGEIFVYPAHFQYIPAQSISLIIASILKRTIDGLSLGIDAAVRGYPERFTPFRITASSRVTVPKLKFWNSLF